MIKHNYIDISVKLGLLICTIILSCWCGYMRYTYGHIAFSGMNHRANVTRSDNFALIVTNDEHKMRTQRAQYCFSSQQMFPKDKRKLYKLISNLDSECKPYNQLLNKSNDRYFGLEYHKSTTTIGIGTIQWDMLGVRCEYLNDLGNTVVEEKYYKVRADEIEEFVNHMLDQVDDSSKHALTF